MEDPTVRLKQADDATLSYVETLLERNDLPSRDVHAKPDCFYVGYDGGDPVGVGGIERYGTDALLRSVVVDESLRGTGYGTALCAALEAEARAEGIDTLYLLTTTAADFFASRGYVVIERTAAPSTIRRTTEFADLCPATATCLQKPL